MRRSGSVAAVCGAIAEPIAAPGAAVLITCSHQILPSHHPAAEGRPAAFLRQGVVSGRRAQQGAAIAVQRPAVLI